MTKTTTSLKDLAELALKLCRSSLTKTNGVEPLIVVGFTDGTTKQINLADEFYSLMGSGKGKDLLFTTVRQAVEHFHAVSVVFGNEAWVGRSTALAMSLPEAEFERLSRKHSVTELAEMGLVERTEEIVVTAQDAETVCIVRQSFRRLGNGTPYCFGEPQTNEMPQSEFFGRQKMFGDLREENLR